MSKLPDEKILKDLEQAILKSVGGEEILKVEFPALIRRALDEIIDTPRTGRLKFDQVEKTEKTYLGTKVEILFRNLIGFPKGILDLSIDGVDVDIKNTIGGNWTLPPEVFGKACVLIRSNEKTATCSLGLFIVRPEYLSKGENRDKKKTIAAANFNRIKWLLKDFSYPANIWENTDPKIVQRIFEPKSGTERLIRLFREMQNIPVARSVVEGIAQQKDYMKRLRKNGGARDKLAKESIALLSGLYDQKLIATLGLPVCSAEEFIAFKAQTLTHKKLLQEKLET